MDRKFGTGRCKLLHLEWVSNKILLYSTGNYIQSLGINYNGKGYLIHKCVSIQVTLLYDRDWHNIVNQLYFNKNKQNL